MEGIWAFVIIGGPIVLGLVLLWAIFNNRTSRAQKAATEAATKRMHEEQNRDDQRRDGNG